MLALCRVQVKLICRLQVLVHCRVQVLPLFLELDVHIPAGMRISGHL